VDPLQLTDSSAVKETWFGARASLALGLRRLASEAGRYRDWSYCVDAASPSAGSSGGVAGGVPRPTTAGTTEKI